MTEAPASSGQALLWFLSQRGGLGIGLNCPVTFRVDGVIDPARLRDALAKVVRRHAALRTGLVRKGRKLVQRVEDDFTPPVRFARPGDGSEAVLTAIRSEILAPVPVDRPSLRVLVLTGADGSHVCLSMHHAIADGRSGQILFDDLAAAYGGADLCPVPGFEVAAYREAEYLSGPEARRDAARLAAELARSDPGAVPFDPAKPARLGRTGQRRLALEPRLSSRLSALAETSGLGDFALYLAIHLATLHRLTGVRHPGVATLYANRTDPDLAETVGYFVTMQYLAASVSPGITLRAFSQEVASRAREASLRQRFPLHLLPMGANGRAGRADDCVFQLLPYRFLTGDFWGRNATPYLPPVQPRRFDFEVTVVPGPEKVKLLVTWNADRLAAGFADAFAEGYRAVAVELADDPDQPLARIA